MNEVSINLAYEVQGKIVRVETTKGIFEGKLSGVHGNVSASLDGAGITSAIDVTDFASKETRIYAPMVKKFFVVE